MTRLPSETDLVASIDYSLEQLQRVRLYAGDLLRRRRFGAGGDGYPASSMGGGSSTGANASSTERAALSGPMADPVARNIDQVIEMIVSTDALMQRAGNCLKTLLSEEADLRGRQSSIVICDCCGDTISNVGDDRRRSGFCPACYKAWMRYRTSTNDPSRIVFITRRQQQLVPTSPHA